MRVYKFGGASVRSAEGIRNMAHILSMTDDAVFVVISAMGKTTNALEVVLDKYMDRNTPEALQKLQEVFDYHTSIISELFADEQAGLKVVKPLFQEIKDFVTNILPADYDKSYDALVSYGEIISTTIVSAYLNTCGVQNKWLDMRRLLLTDSNFREANVRMEESETNLRAHVNFSQFRIYVSQGFIGGNMQGCPTTLGREGSDYTAAVVGNLLQTDSVTIWKDVPGILNADPRLFPNATLIPELTYYDAVELAYSGAQVIHPKTIKPLENKKIPLYVKPFLSPEASGSVIKATTANSIDIPVIIIRKNQVLITVRPRDFSFVLEDGLSRIFNLLHKHRLKVSMIQSSAVTISVCVDKTRYVDDALDELCNEFKVTYNEGLELVTIRGITQETIRQTTEGRKILLTQKTRRTARFLLKE